MISLKNYSIINVDTCIITLVSKMSNKWIIYSKCNASIVQKMTKSLM